MYKTEKQLQQACYMEFHNTYPELRGCIFMVKNETTSNLAGMGLVRGVSDLCGCINARFVAFELKLSGTRHETKHLKEQLEWAEKIEANGGFHAFIFSVDQFMDILKSVIGGYEYRKHFRKEHPLNVIKKAAEQRTKTAKLNF